MIEANLEKIKQNISAETIAELKAFGEWSWDQPWPDYKSLSLNDKKIQELIQILKDDIQANFDNSGDEVLSWVPVHAWRTLAEHKVVEAIPVIIDRLMQDIVGDDFVHEDIPATLKRYGPTVIDFIFKEFTDEIIFGQDSIQLFALLEVLVEIANKYPEEKNRIILFFNSQLEQFEVMPPDLNSFLISVLIDLNATESAPLIQQVFERQFLDESVLDWKFVREKFHLNSDFPENIKHNKYKPNDFSYSGDLQFQKLLKSLDSLYNIDDVKFLALGAISAIDFVQPEKVAEVILSHAEADNDGFQTEGQALYFYKEFLGLWNELSDYQNKLFSWPEFVETNLTDLSEPQRLSIVLYWATARLFSFRDGLLMGNTHVDRMYYLGLSKVENFLTLIENKELEIKLIHNQGAYPIDFSNLILNKLKNDWNDNYMDFVTESKVFRAESLKKKEFIKSHKDVGRNDACPCGSHKKFKKCCLVANG